MKFYLIPLFFFVISSVSAVTISNTTLSSSNGYSVYSNYSTENSVTITSTSININQPTAESLFTALSNSFLNITNLISPYNDINYSNLGSLIIDTANANVNILIGEPLKIFNYIAPSGGTVNVGGGGVKTNTMPFILTIAGLLILVLIFVFAFAESVDKHRKEKNKHLNNPNS